jgi:uncharacterized protein (TIGR03663 family)
VSELPASMPAPAATVDARGVVSKVAAEIRAWFRADTRLILAVGVIVLVALVMRTVELGERASHHDESLHALFSYRFAEGKGYRHDPLMHGPLQFHIIGATFKVFGASDAISRAPAAIFGALLVGLPLLLRRYIGAPAVLAMAILLTISPSLLYYSRFARNEAFVAVETLLLAVAIWRYREEGGMRWLVLLAVTIALQFATKETAFLIAAVFLLYVNGALTAVLVDRLQIEEGKRLGRTLLLFPIAWAIAATWPVTWKRFGEGERPREVDLMVVLGTLVLPYLAAAIQLPLSLFDITLDEGSRERLVGGLLVSTLFVAAGEIGIWWDWRRWLLLAGIAVTITILLFTTFFTNPAGFAGAYWNQLDYWLAQQEVQRGGQPWFYYLFMVPLYEFAALVPAVIGGAILLARGDRLTRLLGWWALGTFIALSAAGEKMPWLTVHVALPLAILGGYVLGRLVGAVRSGDRPRRISATVALGGATLLALLAIRNGVAVAYTHPDTPIEPLIYTQTSPDIPVIARQIEAYAATRGGKELPVLVDASESMAWPWAWYLRDYTNASYVDVITEEPIPPNAVLLLWRATEQGSGTIGEGYYHELFTHRWWFPEDAYRATSIEGLTSGLLDGSLPRNIVSFYVRGEERWRIGRLEGVALFPETPPEVTLPSTGETYGR